MLMFVNSKHHPTLFMLGPKLLHHVEWGFIITPSENYSKSKTNNTTGKTGLNLVKLLSFSM
jgi:hypothetical protein